MVTLQVRYEPDWYSWKLHFQDAQAALRRGLLLLEVTADAAIGEAKPVAFEVVDTQGRVVVKGRRDEQAPLPYRLHSVHAQAG